MAINTNNSVAFIYPESVRIAVMKHLVDANINVKDRRKYLYLLNLLYLKKLESESKYEEEGVRLNLSKLASILAVNNGTASRIMRDLINWKFICRIGGYTKGVSAYSYKLHNRIENENVGFYSMEAVRKNDFIEKLKSKTNISKDEAIVRYQRTVFDKITLSEDGVDFLKWRYPALSEYLDNKSNCAAIMPISTSVQFRQLDTMLVKIILQDFFVVRPDPKNRLYSNMTSLKREFRNFVLLNGKPIFNIDLANSQVVFGCLVVQKCLKAKGYNELPKDYQLFRRLCFEGELYEYLAAQAELKNEILSNRKAFKQRFFREVWYGRTPKSRRTKLYRAFEKLFPSVLSVILELKKDDYRQFPIKLQRLEAKMMLDKIGQKLMEQGLDFITIHDSFLFCNDSDVQFFYKCVEEEFSKAFNAIPKFKNEKEEKAKLRALNIYERFRPTPLYRYYKMEQQWVKIKAQIPDYLNVAS